MTLTYVIQKLKMFWWTVCTRKSIYIVKRVKHLRSDQRPLKMQPPVDELPPTDFCWLVASVTYPAWKFPFKMNVYRYFCHTLCVCVCVLQCVCSVGHSVCCSVFCSVSMAELVAVCVAVCVTVVRILVNNTLQTEEQISSLRRWQQTQHEQHRQH